jgi:hypothetical protein
MNIEDIINNVNTFSSNNNLTKRIAQIESDLKYKKSKEIASYLDKNHVCPSAFQSALTIKELAGQINVIIHTLGILVSLSYILETDEEIQCLSLGAGNTGKKFDLETNKRIAEFKFINWQGGPESIRQNSIFIDLFNLAEHTTHKKRYLYVQNKVIPLQFFNGGRALKSVLSKNKTAHDAFYNKYGNKYSRVFEYYNYVKGRVDIVDLGDIVSAFKK